MAPNGDVFVSEGHNQSPQAPPETVSRISKFTQDGKFIRSFGKLGSGPGEFRGPHDLAMDTQGRIFLPTGELSGFKSYIRTENTSESGGNSVARAVFTSGTT
jgi:hypothetical protein